MIVVERKTHTIDANGRTLGRLATEIVRLLQGKNKVGYSRHRDDGEFVVVKNIQQIIFKGRKKEQKTYFRYSGYPGGISKERLEELWTKNPAAVLTRVVTQMLADNTLRKKRLRRLIIEDKRSGYHKP
jgi:large subunit ribosomal protein L13